MKLLMTIALKELRETFRDRRSLTAALVFALFGPLMLGMALTSISQRSSGPTRLALDAEALPHLATFLQRQPDVEVLPLPTGDLQAAVLDGEVPVVLLPGTPVDGASLAAPSSAGTSNDELDAQPVRLLYDASDRRSRSARGRVQALLRGYENQVAGQRLTLRGVVPAITDVLDVHSLDLSTAAQRAALPLAMLPVFLLMAGFVSCMNTAIDATAGERERGSLEPLLHTPAPAWTLAGGKWLTATLLAATGIVLTLLAMLFVLDRPSVQALELRFQLGWAELPAYLAVLLPLAPLAAGVQLLLATVTRSFKEAQTYLSLLIFLPILPGFLFQFGVLPDHLRHLDALRAVPLLGQELLLGDLLRGVPTATVWVALAAVASIGLGALAAAGTGRLLQHERIVFGR